MIEKSEDIAITDLFHSSPQEAVDLNNPNSAAEDSDEDSYNTLLMTLISDARDYEMSVLRPKRELEEQFFRGDIPALSEDESEDDEEGRSSVVSMQVRDTIMAMLPSLIRIFASPEHVVEFVPNNAATAAKAQEQTDYISLSFWEDNEGFLILHSVLKDALNKGMGVTQWWTDTTVTVKYGNYRGITQGQYQYLISQEGAEVIAEQQIPSTDPEDPTPMYDLDLKVVTKENVLRVEAVPPEEFRINKYAKSARKSRIVGRERTVPWSDLLMIGHTKEDIAKWKDSENGLDVGMERIFRNPGQEDGIEDTIYDDEINYGEWWVLIDKDDDGIHELRKIRTVGDLVIHDEPTNRLKMAIFTPDPEPHTAIGHSINEQMQDLQIISTNILRSTLDGVAASNNPRIAVVESMVNMEDVLSDKVGAPIRMKAAGMATPFQTMFASDPAMGMMDRIDAMGQRRSGISEASKGLDPKALQSTTVKGVDMVITGAQERIELVARVLAETGFKEMFLGMLHELHENPNKKRTVKIRGEWVDIDPSKFDPSLSVRVNPALGRGSDMDRYMILNSVKQTQELIISTAGMDNPMVSPANYFNTINDILAIGGIKNTARYFTVPSEDKMKEFMERKAKEPNPQVMLAEAEVGKAQAENKKADAQTEKIKADTVKTIGTMTKSSAEYDRDDDFRRDQLEAKTQIDAAALGIDAVGILAGIKEDRDEESSAA